MVKLADPTLPFADVVRRRRRERAATDAEAFRFGAVGRDWRAVYPEPGSSAVIGASARALGTEEVEHTLEVIGAVGGLLVDMGCVDMGCQVCPVGASAGQRLRPSLVVWVSGADTLGEELDQLVALGVPGVWVGWCIEAPYGWRRIDSSEFDDRNQFIRGFVAAVTELVDPRLSVS